MAFSENRFNHLEMETVKDFIVNQLVLVVVPITVVVGAIFVYIFGFKRAEQPPFTKLATVVNDDKKSKDKKQPKKDKKVT